MSEASNTPKKLDAASSIEEAAGASHGVKEPQGSAASSPYRCHRCDIDCELTPHYEGSAMLSWYCTCCRSRTRTVDMIEADAERRATEKGITVDELFEESKALIDHTPLSPEALADLRSFADKRAEEWEPACVHDTENPWR